MALPNYEKNYNEMYPKELKNATLSSKVTGLVRYAKIGNVVIVDFSDFEIKGEIASHGEVLVTGLPKPTTYLTTSLPNYGTPNKPLRMGITQNGTIQTHYSNTFTNISTGFYGTLVYLTNE